MGNSRAMPQDGRKMFFRLGACSRTFAFLLDREFGHLNEMAERASNPFAGGIIQKGHQCGMLWGSALAVGAEAFRRNDDRGQAIASAITATQHVMESFSKRTGHVDCLEVTGLDWTNKLDTMKYMFSGRFLYCFTLAKKWAPEAVQSAKEGLSHEDPNLPQQPISCATEVARRMGAGEEEMITVAGFAGGLGLGGYACGALGAVLWLDSLAWCREHPGKSPSFFKNADANRTLEAFYGETDSEILCHKIAGQRFETNGEHTEFMNNGGCDTLLDVLARS